MDHCPGCTVLHVLDGVDQSPIRPKPYDLHVFGMPKKALKDHIFRLEVGVRFTKVRWFQQKGYMGDVSKGCPHQCLSDLFLIAPFTQNNPQIVSSHLAWYFFLWSNSIRKFPWPAAVIYDTEGQVQIVLSAILSVNKIIYSVKFVYSFKKCHHMAI